MVNENYNKSSNKKINCATRTIASILGIIFGIGGFGHGYFEALQGFTPTNGLIIEAIGEANRMWEYGNEPAFTIIPNFLITGIAAMIVSIVIIILSVGFLHKKNGSKIFILLFILLFLVGGGIGHILFFIIIWAYSTRIHKPLTWWKKVLPIRLCSIIAKLCPLFIFISSLGILFALEIAIFGIVPGITNPDTVTIVMLSSLGVGFIFMHLSFISGFAYDIAK